MSDAPRTRNGERCVHAAMLSLAAVALMHARPVAGQSVPAVEAIARIGCGACDGPAAFADIGYIAIGPANTIYAIDSTEPHVRVFRENGEAVTAFGRRGDGPGEFRGPSFIDVRPDGGLTILDIRTRRMSRLAPDGTELETFPLRQFPIAAAATESGDLWLATTDFRAPTLSIEWWPAGADASQPITRLSPDFPKRDESTPSSIVALAASPAGGFAIADGAFFYRIGLHDSHGERTAWIDREIPRRKLTAAEVAEEEARRDRNARRMAAMRVAEGGAPGSPPPVPEVRAHFLRDALQYDRRGRLWVRTERGTADEAIFDLFDPQNRFIGELSVPGRMRRFAIGGDLLAGVVYDADEAQYIQLYRIRG